MSNELASLKLHLAMVQATNIIDLLTVRGIKGLAVVRMVVTLNS